MQREQKILVTFLWGLAVLAMLSVVGMGFWGHRAGDASDSAANEQRLSPLYDAPSFTLTDQNGATVSTQSLRGSVWIGMVFFTHCPGICPGMMSKMTDVQKACPNQKVKIVAFSLDPERDTPEAMKDYAERFRADGARWHLLTGPKDTMYEVAKGLKLAATPATDSTPINHTAKVLLIDQSGRIRGIYDTNDDATMKQLAEDALLLAASTRG